jgi:hypothetical protein
VRGAHGAIDILGASGRDHAETFGRGGIGQLQMRATEGWLPSSTVIQIAMPR